MLRKVTQLLCSMVPCVDFIGIHSTSSYNIFSCNRFDSFADYLKLKINEEIVTRQNYSGTSDL